MAQACSPALAGNLEPAQASGLARFFHRTASARPQRVICVVLAVWMLNGFDLTFTILAHQQGYLAEQNPLARLFLANGPASVALFKVGLVLIGSYPLLKFRQAIITEMASLIILMAYAMLAVHWSECYRLYTLTSGTPVNLAELSSATTIWLP